MKILVLGASGMLGHKVIQVLAQSDHEVWAAARPNGAASLEAFFHKRPPRPFMVPTPQDVDSGQLCQLVCTIAPDVLINCVGLVKQRKKADSVAHAAPVNAILPHLLAAACDAARARMIHVSTDCVFSGQKGVERGTVDFYELGALDDGAFSEELRHRGFLHTKRDRPDATDVYGRTKTLGEIGDQAHVLTIRTSLVGPELTPGRSLLEWLIAQVGDVSGFLDHYWTGVTTLRFAEVLRDHVLASDLSGLVQLASPPIHKARLLELFVEHLELSIDVHRIVSSRPMNRALDGKPLDDTMDLRHPTWPELVHGTARDFHLRRPSYRRD